MGKIRLPSAIVVHILVLCKMFEGAESISWIHSFQWQSMLFKVMGVGFQRNWAEGIHSYKTAIIIVPPLCIKVMWVMKFLDTDVMSKLPWATINLKLKDLKLQGIELHWPRWYVITDLVTKTLICTCSF